MPEAHHTREDQPQRQAPGGRRRHRRELTEPAISIQPRFAERRKPVPSQSHDLPLPPTARERVLERAVTPRSATSNHELIHERALQDPLYPKKFDQP